MRRFNVRGVCGKAEAREFWEILESYPAKRLTLAKGVSGCRPGQHPPKLEIVCAGNYRWNRRKEPGLIDVATGASTGIAAAIR